MPLPGSWEAPHLSLDGTENLLDFSAIALTSSSGRTVKEVSYVPS